MMADHFVRLDWEIITQSWRFWLQPNNAQFDQEKHKHLLLACSNEQNENLLTIVPDIVAGLRRIEEKTEVNRAREDKHRCSTRTPSTSTDREAELQRSDFERVFSNASLKQALEKDPGNPFSAFARIAPGESAPPSLPWAQVVLFKALYLYLLQDERYRFIDAHIAFVYCAWQRYNLIKKLHQSLPSASQSPPQPQRADLRAHEFVSAYRALAELLAQEEFSYAFYALWCYGRREEGAEELSPPLIRERFELSLVLESPPLPEETKEPREKPHNAPLCFRTSENWSQVGLYPPFRKQWRPTVHRLIRDRLLPRYNVPAAVRLAARCQGPANKAVWRMGVGGVAALGLFFTLFPLVWRYLYASPSWRECLAWAIVSAPPLLNTVLDHYLQGTNGWSESLPFIPILLLLVIALLFLEWGSLPILFFPRLWGGMVIGYLPLMFNDSTWWIVRGFIPPAGSLGGLLLLWTVLVSIAAFYLFYEASAAVGDAKEACRRSLIVLAWSLLVSLAVGILFSLLAAPIYVHEREDSLGPLSPELFPHTSSPVSIPALLVFAPIALFIGIVLQFIWEEKPVTATIWPTPERK